MVAPAVQQHNGGSVILDRVRTVRKNIYSFIYISGDGCLPGPLEKKEMVMKTRTMQQYGIQETRSCGDKPVTFDWTECAQKNRKQNNKGPFLCRRLAWK